MRFTWPVGPSLVAAVIGLLQAACGSSQTSPGPLPTAAPSGSAWGALHVLGSGGLIASYAISREDGRLLPVGSVPGVTGAGPEKPRLAADPDGRFVFAASDSRIQPYAVGRDGRLAPRADLSFVSAVAGPDCSAHRAESLSASRQFVYLVSSCRLSSTAQFALDRFSVADDGRLVALGSMALGTLWSTSGAFLLADPGGQAVYRQWRWNGMVVQDVRPGGALGQPPA